MRIIQLRLYSIDELSDAARERALQKLRYTLDYPWAEDNRRTLEEFIRIFPVRVVAWFYDCCSCYIDWRFTDSDDIANLEGLRLYKYLWNNYEHAIFKDRFYYRNGRKRYSKIFLSNSCVLTGYWLDDVILGPIYSFLEKPTDTTFYYLLNECLNAWVRACAKDVEDYYSDESLLEEALANEYEFLEDGTLKGVL